MGIEGSQAEDDGEIEGEAQSAAEGEAEKPTAPPGYSGFRIAKEFEDLVQGSGAKASLEKAIASFNAVNPAFESARRLVDQSGVLAAVMRLQTDFSKVVIDASGAASALAASLRWMDQLSPLDKSVSQFALTSLAVEQFVGSGALASWRSALEANSRIEARLRELAVPTPLFSELARISRTQVDLTDWAVLRAPGKGLLSETSGMPVVAWRSLVSDSVNDEDELPTVVTTGRTNLGLLGSDLLTSPGAEPGLIAEGTDRVRVRGRRALDGRPAEGHGRLVCGARAD